MSLATSTQFRWPQYTLRWILRAVAVMVFCSFVFGSIASGLTSGQLLVTAVGSVVTGLAVGGVLFWTVAEMIADGLS